MAQHLGNDAFDFGKAAGDAQVRADVAVSHAGLRRSRDVLALFFPHGLAFGRAGTLDFELPNVLETQFARRNVGGNGKVGPNEFDGRGDLGRGCGFGLDGLRFETRGANQKQ